VASCNTEVAMTGQLLQQPNKSLHRTLAMLVPVSSVVRPQSGRLGLVWQARLGCGRWLCSLVALPAMAVATVVVLWGRMSGRVVACRSEAQPAAARGRLVVAMACASWPGFAVS
jgi:hypothetical protein